MTIQTQQHFNKCIKPVSCSAPPLREGPQNPPSSVKLGWEQALRSRNEQPSTAAAARQAQPQTQPGQAEPAHTQPRSPLEGKFPLGAAHSPGPALLDLQLSILTSQNPLVNRAGRRAHHSASLALGHDDARASITRHSRNKSTGILLFQD